MDAIAVSANKREVATALGLTAARVSCIVHESRDVALARAWADLPAGGAFAGASATVPGPCVAQAKADKLLLMACEADPIDPRATQRRNVVDLLVSAYRLNGDSRLPRGWVRAAAKAFEEADHPLPPTPATLRWYNVRLRAEPEIFSDVPSVAAALAESPPGTGIWATRSRPPRPSSLVRMSPQGLVAEACEDAPVDPARNKRANVVLLLLALYNITGTLSWPGGWTAEVIVAFERAGFEPPTTPSLRWFRKQLRDDPRQFVDVVGADPQLIQDLIEREAALDRVA